MSGKHLEATAVSFLKLLSQPVCPGGLGPVRLRGRQYCLSLGLLGWSNLFQTPNRLLTQVTSTVERQSKPVQSFTPPFSLQR